MFLDILENPTYCLGIPYRFLFPCTASRQPLLNPYCGNLSHNGEVLIENIQKYPTVTFLFGIILLSSCSSSLPYRLSVVHLSLTLTSKQCGQTLPTLPQNVYVMYAYFRRILKSKIFRTFPILNPPGSSRFVIGTIPTVSVIPVISSSCMTSVLYCSSANFKRKRRNLKSSIL